MLCKYCGKRIHKVFDRDGDYQYLRTKPAPDMFTWIESDCEHYPAKFKFYINAIPNTKKQAS